MALLGVIVKQKIKAKQIKIRAEIWFVTISRAGCRRCSCCCCHLIFNDSDSETLLCTCVRACVCVCVCNLFRCFHIIFKSRLRRQQQFKHVHVSAQLCECVCARSRNCNLVVVAAPFREATLAHNTRKKQHNSNLIRLENGFAAVFFKSAGKAVKENPDRHRSPWWRYGCTKVQETRTEQARTNRSLADWNFNYRAAERCDRGWCFVFFRFRLRCAQHNVSKRKQP